MKNRKRTTLLVALALVVALVGAIALAGCGEPKEYTLTYAVETGVEGTVPEAVVKKDGETVTLAGGGDLSKDGYAFMGWTDGTASYAAGAEYTLKGNVTMTAVFAEKTTYSNCFGNFPMIKTAFTAGDRFVIDYTSYNGAVYNTVYTFTESETSMELTLVEVPAVNEAAADKIGSKYTLVKTKDALLGSAFAVTGDSAAMMSEQSLVLFTTVPKYPEGLTSAGASGEEYKGTLVLYKNGLAVYEHNEWSTKVKTFKYGTYTKSSADLYNVTFNGETAAVTYKVTLNNYGGADYVTSDGYNGAYTLGSQTVNLDGFAGWDNGTYTLFAVDNEAMVYLNDEDLEISGLYNISGKTLTAVTTGGEYKLNGSGEELQKIYYNGSLVGGMTSSASYTTKLNNNAGALEFFGGELYYEIKYDTEHNQFEATIMDYEAGSERTSYYTIGGVAPVIPGVETTLETGEYVNNLDSSVTASITEADGVYTLSLTKGGGTPATYTITRKGEKLTITAQNNSATPKDCYIVNGVICAKTIKASNTNVMIALSKTALTSVEGMAAGYAKNPASSSAKLYLFTNNVAIYTTGAYTGMIGTYTAESNVYTVSNADKTSAVYKLVPDEGSTAAYYIVSDGLAGTYTAGDVTITLDGFGTYTKGGASGKYVAGKTGFGIYEDGVITDKYTINASDKTLTAVTQGTEKVEGTVSGVTNVTAPTTKDILTGKKISFADGFTVYLGTGCADITYTVTDEAGTENTTTVTIGLGQVITINGVEFTVTKCNDTGINMTFKEGSQTKNVTYDETGVPG